MIDILSCFMRDPVLGCCVYDGIDWFVTEGGSLGKSKAFRASVPCFKQKKSELRLSAFHLLQKHAGPVRETTRSDRVWERVQRLKWYREGAILLRPEDYPLIPDDEMWAVPPPEEMGVWCGHGGTYGLGTRRGAKVLRYRVRWMSRFDRI